MRRTLTILASVMALGFGIVYAAWVTLNGGQARHAWKLVVAGDLITDMGMSFVLYIWTRSLKLALVPYLFHLLTGVPMIIAQIMKHRFLDSEAEALIKEL